MTNQTSKIVVLGGGYAGIMAALRIAGKTKRLNTAVMLINALDHFVERPRLHEQATGSQLAGRSMQRMLEGTKAQFMKGWVTNINPDDQWVGFDTAEGWQQVAYDYLVIALGSKVDKDSVPGVKKYAFTLDPYGPMTTTALEQKLREYKNRRFRLIVGGGGATGIEAATQIKAAHPLSEVTLISQGEAAAFKGPRIQELIKEALYGQNIRVIEHQRIMEINADGVVLANEELAGEVMVWAGGFVASALARDAGMQVNGRNQVLTDSFLRSRSHLGIYAVGDMASPIEEPGAPMRMSLFTALVSGAQAADNIAADLKGKEQRPLSFAWYGQAIALGPSDAVGFATYPVDEPVGPVYRGKTAVAIRNFFVQFLKSALELERRFPGILTWNGKKRFAKNRKRKLQQAEATYQH